jgi:hypothetical protein
LASWRSYARKYGGNRTNRTQIIVPRPPRASTDDDPVEPEHRVHQHQAEHDDAGPWQRSAHLQVHLVPVQLAGPDVVNTMVAISEMSDATQIGW